MQFIIVERSGTIAYINTVDWIQSTNGILGVAISVPTMVLSAILEIRTLIEYRRLSRNRKCELREDFSFRHGFSKSQFDIINRFARGFFSFM